MSEQPQPGPGEAPSSGSDFVALARSPGFWVIMRYAALFGVVLAFAALAFLGLVNDGTKLWFTLPKNPGWFDGSLWWVAVTAGRRGARRRAAARLRAPGQAGGHGQGTEGPAGRALRRCREAVAVSLVSLAGGASLGPEDALGKMGGGLGTWVSERKQLDEDDARDEHAQRDVRRLRRPAVISGAGDDPHARSRASRRHSASRTRWSRACCLPRSRSPCTSRSPGRRSSGSTSCRPSSTRTGNCSPPSPSASSPGRSR